MDIQRQWRSLNGLLLFEICVCSATAGGAEHQTREAINEALKEARIAGFDPSHVMRSRLWCRDASSRRIASDVRREMLTGELRAASASFFDAARLPPGADVRFDLVAISADREGSRKIIHEYEPAITPPMLAALGTAVFLSGNTDEAPHFHVQAAHIRAKIDTALQSAGAQLADAVIFDAYIAGSIDMAIAVQHIHEHFAEVKCPLTLHHVEGFSAPAKRLEIEITAMRR